tara:strand:- start:471 stop:1013 length:543 start_codon:yes stop_codon:yes gene_type:complete
VSYESLKDALLTEAATQADEVAARFNDQLKSEKERIAQRAKGAEEEIIAQAESLGEVEASRLHQEHQLAAKANVLVAKQEELDETQTKVVDEILAWDGAATGDLLTHLLKLAPADAELTAGAKHADALKKAGAKNVASETISGDGGFIARAANEEVNLTIRHLVAQLFIRHRAAIAAQLF